MKPQLRDTIAFLNNISNKIGLNNSPYMVYSSHSHQTNLFSKNKPIKGCYSKKLKTHKNKRKKKW